MTLYTNAQVSLSKSCAGVSTDSRAIGCGLVAHPRCTDKICLVCPAAFHPKQIVAAFARCFASLFYTYRKFLTPASTEQKKSGQLFNFNMDGFQKSVPSEHAQYIGALRETQGMQCHLFIVLLLYARGIPIITADKDKRSTSSSMKPV